MRLMRRLAKAPPPLVITVCSAGKRCRRSVYADELPVADQGEVAGAWVARLAEETVLTPARSLYAGRAFGLAARSADAIGAHLGIVSAGLGYVRSEKPIPSYDLTVRRGGPGSVVRRIKSRFEPRFWWRQMNDGPFASDLMSDLRGRTLVLVCLSRAYAALIADDLTWFARQHPAALRVFGLSIASGLPADLRPFVMPYDERLEGLGTPGTRLDFPQRALADYVTHVWREGYASPERDAAEVTRRLSGVARQERTRAQQRVDDATVRDLILRALPTVGSSGSRMLAHLRRVEGVSVEQARFAGLFRAVRQEAAT